jgi:hypothetical protein
MPKILFFFNKLWGDVHVSIFQKFNLSFKNYLGSVFSVKERDSEKIVKILFDAVKEILEQRKVEYIVDEIDPLYFEFLFFEERKILIDDYQVLYSYNCRPPKKIKIWKLEYERVYDGKYDYYPIVPNFDLGLVVKWITKRLDKDIKLKKMNIKINEN